MGLNKMNQSVVMLLVFFIFSYIVLWFLGGACIDFLSGGVCFSTDAVSSLSRVPFLNLILPFNSWNSLMYWVAPIAGILMSYFVLKWYNSYYETKFAASIWIPLLLIITLIFGYFINLSWYYGETATLNSRDDLTVGLYFCFSEPTLVECNAVVGKINQELINQAQSANLSVVQQNIPISFWSELRESIFLTFILGAIIGWAPLFVKNFLESKNN